jgi:hypothetical protein
MQSETQATESKEDCGEQDGSRCLRRHRASVGCGDRPKLRKK